MTGLRIKSMWFADALDNERLSAAIKRLRLKSGEFVFLEDYVKKTGDLKGIRMFFAEGPRGGVHGILLARRPKMRGGVTSLGVYVDRKRRREGIGKSLVEAARTYYPSALLRGNAWSGASLQFWTHVKPIVGQSPLQFFMTR